jgi:hypothetical protein
MAIPSPQLVDQLPEGKVRGFQPGRVNVTSMKARGAVSQPEDRHRTRVAERPFLMEHDILKVTNIDTVPWEFGWDRRKYLIKPHETGFVPFPAVVIKMGDPRSAPDVVTRFNSEDGQRGIIATRHEVLCSLYAHYGIGNEDMAELVDFAPKLEVRTMADDMLVQFPAQDPDMPPWPVPQVAQPGRENSDMRRLTDNLAEENRQMREELADMRAMISGRLSGEQTAPAEPEYTEDGDTQDALAAALAGASVDQGPSTQLR